MFSNKGLTLIELLIVIVIVGVLAAIAVPSYNRIMVSTRRSDAKVALEQLRAAQEMRRAERGSYSTDIAELRTTWGVTAVAGDYNIDFDGAAVLTANTYTAEAQPWNARQAGDGSLFIDHLGRKWDNNNEFWPEGKWGKTFKW